jgi:hypothetical protein
MASDPVALVRAMWDAELHGDIEDVIATMHPDVVWAPFSGGELTYSGHDGIRRMRDATHAVLGAPEIMIDDVSLLADGTVLSRGHAIGRHHQPLAFEARCQLRDGLIVGVYSRSR